MKKKPKKPRVYKESEKVRHTTHWDIDYLPLKEVDALYGKGNGALPVDRPKGAWLDKEKLAGYFRRFEAIVMRLVDVFMAFPDLLMALVLMAILGRGITNVIIAVGATYLTRTARIIHGLTLKIKNEPYIEAIYSEGASHARILARHVVPNLISLIIVQATFTFAFSLLQIAALDFLGVGVPPQIPSWGNMLSEGRIFIVRAPWLLIFPGTFIVLTVLSFNLVGDVLRDRIDPRFREAIEGV